MPDARLQRCRESYDPRAESISRMIDGLSEKFEADPARPYIEVALEDLGRLLNALNIPPHAPPRQ